MDSIILFPLNIFIFFFGASTSAHVIVQSSAVGDRKTDLDDNLFEENILFEVKVSTRVECAAACLEYACCFTFTTSTKEPTSQLMTCRGHDSRLTSERSSVAVNGSRTFLMNRPHSATTSSWLNKICSSQGDCASDHNNTVCFKGGQCLCSPGYYYSHCRDGCLPACPGSDLQSTFLTYPSHHISGNNMQTISDCTVAMAKEACLGNPECRSFDRSGGSYNKCWLQKVTPLDVPSDFEVLSNSNYYQRTCL